MILRQPQCPWLHDGLAATSFCGVLTPGSPQVHDWICVFIHAAADPLLLPTTNEASVKLVSLSTLYVIRLTHESWSVSHGCLGSR